MEVFKNIMWVLLGVVIAFVLTCTIIGIASAVNDVSFGQQIVDWFGTTVPTIDEPVEEVIEAVSQTPNV